MKLIYVFTSASIASGSVQKKVIEQIKALRLNGADCKGLFFTTDEFVNSESECFEFVSVPRIPKSYFRSAKQRIAYHHAVYNYFNQQNIETDFIYVRYPGAGKYIAKWVSKWGSKIFFEHLTSETLEIKLYAQENPFRWNLSSILSRLEFLNWPLYNEWRYGKIIRSKAAFGIANSNDIANYENTLAYRDYVKLINGDAVNTSHYNIVEKAEFNEHFNMVFLKGAVTQADFNGLDRLFKGMANYQGPKKLHLHLYGRNLEHEKQLIQSLGIQDKVTTGDFIEKEAIDKLMPSIHLGIAALGVHRKGLKGTTTIKSREYCARGIPFIYGHNDPDFSACIEAEKFCKEYPANDSNIDMTELIEWYGSICKNPNLSKEMHAFSELYLDYNSKMKKLKELLSTWKN